MDHTTAKIYGFVILVGIIIFIKIMINIFGRRIITIILGTLAYLFISFIIYMSFNDSSNINGIVTALVIIYIPYILFMSKKGFEEDISAKYSAHYDDVLKNKENLLKLLNGESPMVNFDLIKKIAQNEYSSFQNIDNGFSIEYLNNHFELTIVDKKYMLKKENIQARLNRIQQEEETKTRQQKKNELAKKQAIQKEKDDKLYALENSPLTNYFNAEEGGETTLYYLKLENKFGEIRYKVGVTLNNVQTRYSNQYKYKILYEKKLTHANTIEKSILKKFSHLVTDESLLGTNGTEIFNEDVLRLDV